MSIPEELSSLDARWSPRNVRLILDEIHISQIHHVTVIEWRFQFQAYEQLKSPSHQPLYKPCGHHQLDRAWIPVGGGRAARANLEKSLVE